MAIRAKKKHLDAVHKADRTGNKVVRPNGGRAQSDDPVADPSASAPTFPGAGIGASAAKTINGGVLRHLPLDRFPGSLKRQLKTIKAEGGVTFGADAAGSDKQSDNAFREICLLLRSATGVDFLQYKSATINRRIARRMGLQRIDNLAEYLEVLRKNKRELEELYQDILIHVTGFFRDPDAFHALQSKVIPAIAANKLAAQPIRVWVPGCSTGEEVYSIAMSLIEAVGDEFGHTGIQVFGTDVSEPAIQHARSGTYREAGLADVSPARLTRFFVKVGGCYQINKTVRKLCVFACHDLTRDPPFSRLDLVSCRNVLIYLGAALQRRTLEVFHYALRPGGYLFLGKSESLSAHVSLFSMEDRKYKIFSRKQVPTPHLGISAIPREAATRVLPEAPPTIAAFDLKKEAERTLLEHFVPPAMVVDQDLQIVYFQGDTSSYVAPATGEPSFHLLRMLRPDLAMEVRATIWKVKEEGVTAKTGAIRITHNGRVNAIRVEVLPLRGRLVNGCDFLVLFHEDSALRTPIAEEAVVGALTEIAGKGPSQEVVRLKGELTSAREYLRSIVEDHETNREELKAANEEVLSANEELQSTNEELETTKEELQSSNEELTTLNAELQNRNVELVQLSNDLSSLLVGVNIPIVILDRSLRIRRFTPVAEKILNLIPADAGRPFGHIASNLLVTDWDQLFSEVLDQLRTVEREVQDNQGRWYTLRMQPYRTAGNRIDGVLMVLLDIDPVKRSLELARQARDYAEAIVETTREPLLVLDGEMLVLRANTSFYLEFGTSPQETLGRSIFEMGEGHWNIPRLRQLLEELLPLDNRIDDFEVDHQFPAIGHRHMLLNARQLHHVGMSPGMILLAITDITGQFDAGMKALAAGEARYRAIVEDQTELICRFLSNGKLTFVNDAFCRYFGKNADEMIGRNLFEELIADADREAVRSHLAAFSPANPVQTFVRRMDAPSSPWGQWLTRAFFDEEGRIVEFQSVGHDITELKQSEATLIRYQQELRALTARLISAEEANRKRLARELHDVFSQKLAVLGMNITALERRLPETPEAFEAQLRQIADQIGGLAKEIHQMSRQLHPAILDDLGLPAALRNESLMFSEQHGIPVEFTAQGVQNSLPEDVSLCLYRVAQESLRNIGKHATPTEVRVALTGGSEEIALAIEDAGEGFDLEKVRGRGGLGLVSMDERVRLVDGAFSIESEPGRGTRVEVRVPLRRKNA